MEFIGVIILAENEIPGEVRHQTDVAGHAEFHSDAELTEHPNVVIVDRIGRPEFALVGNEATGVDMLLVEKLVGRGATIDEANTACHIRREAAEWITAG